MSARNDGSIEVLTGKTPIRPDLTSTALSDHPDFGLVASRVRGVRPDGMSQYVGIPGQPFMARPAYLIPGFLRPPDPDLARGRADPRVDLKGDAVAAAPERPRPINMDVRVDDPRPAGRCPTAIVSNRWGHAVATAGWDAQRTAAATSRAGPAVERDFRATPARGAEGDDRPRRSGRHSGGGPSV
jgi:hypothetical protein